MRFAAVLFASLQVALSFVIPIKLASVGNVKEQAEILTLQENIWTTTVQIGTPPQEFTVAVDTASSLLFISGDKSRNASFDPTQSSSFLPTNGYYSTDIIYGSSNGEIGMDTVILGASNNLSVTVANATFGQAVVFPVGLPADIDGVLGLAFPPLSPYGSKPVFSTAINQGAVATGIYVIWLEDQWATDDNGTEGVIYYGNNDYLHCIVNQRNLYPLSSATFFQFTVPSFSSTYNGSTYTGGAKYQSIIASSSNYIGLPSAIVGNVLDQLGLDRNTPLPPTVPCNTKIDFSLNFGVKEHITELNLILQQDDGSCKLAMVKSPSYRTTVPTIELGIPFLRGRCTYFDVDTQTIGFSDPITHGGHNDLLADME